jgi:hypothetical protein
MSDRPLEDARRKAEEHARQEAARHEELRAQAQRNINDFIRMMNEAGIEPGNIVAPVYEFVPVGLFGRKVKHQLKPVQPTPRMGWLANCNERGNFSITCEPSYILSDGCVTGEGTETDGKPHPFGCFSRASLLAAQAQDIITSHNALFHAPGHYRG